MLSLIGKWLVTALCCLIGIVVFAALLYFAFEYVFLTLWNFVLGPIWHWAFSFRGSFVGGYLRYPNPFAVFPYTLGVADGLLALAVLVFLGLVAFSIAVIPLAWMERRGYTIRIRFLEGIWEEGNQQKTEEPSAPRGAQ